MVRNGRGVCQLVGRSITREHTGPAVMGFGDLWWVGRHVHGDASVTKTASASLRLSQKPNSRGRDGLCWLRQCLAPLLRRGRRSTNPGRRPTSATASKLPALPVRWRGGAPGYSDAAICRGWGDQSTGLKTAAWPGHLGTGRGKPRPARGDSRVAGKGRPMVFNFPFSSFIFARVRESPCTAFPGSHKKRASSTHMQRRGCSGRLVGG